MLYFNGVSCNIDHPLREIVLVSSPVKVVETKVLRTPPIVSIDITEMVLNSLQEIAIKLIFVRIYSVTESFLIGNCDFLSNWTLQLTVMNFLKFSMKHMKFRKIVIDD